mgnify:CR=1 FL=1
MKHHRIPQYHQNQTLTQHVAFLVNHIKFWKQVYKFL